VEEGSNIEQKDVAELVWKLDAKHDVKAAAQGKGQKNNHSLIEGSDNDTISSVIQSMNRSRVPSSEPRTDVRPKDKDTRSNPEDSCNRNDEFPRRVLSRQCTILWACGDKCVHHDETCAPCEQSCQ